MYSIPFNVYAIIYLTIPYFWIFRLFLHFHQYKQHCYKHPCTYMLTYFLIILFWWIPVNILLVYTHTHSHTHTFTAKLCSTKLDQLHSGVEIGIALHEEELFKKLNTFLSDSHKIPKWRGSANYRAGIIQECPPPPTCPTHQLDLPLLTCKLCVIICYIKRYISAY